MYNQIDSNKRRSILLVVIFIAFICGIGYLISYVYNDVSLLIIAFAISIGMALFGYYQGDKVALSTTGAKEIQKQDNPYVYRMVENLCITAGTQCPKVYIIPDSAMNAFATGRDPQHASIALTTGIIEKLTNEELEGVIAHELSHIRNYDIRLMTLVIVLVGTLSILADIMFHGFGRRRSNSSSESSGGALALIGFILIILSPVIANLIKLAVSRRREYLADASGALLTRYPDGLANALEKIANEDQPMQRASQATAHLFIANPFSSKKHMLKNLFSTHPPIEERIKKLREMTM